MEKQQEQQTPLGRLLKEVYEEWCAKTGNTGTVSLAEAESAAALMGDLHRAGNLLVSEEKARQILWQLLDELNEKSLYIQSRSLLPRLAKRLPSWAKWLILVLGIVALAVGALAAENVSARTQAEQGISGSATYSIA